MKAKFLLPGFVNTNDFINKLPLNCIFVEYMKKEENKHMFYNNEIFAFYDCFSGITWQGGRALTPPKARLQSLTECRNIIEQVNNLGIGIRMVYTNNLLEKRHLNDIYANEITEIIASNSLNSAVVYMPMLRDYLKNKYPNFVIGLSTISDLETAEQINNEIDNWDFITPDFHINNNFEELNKVAQPEKLEILVNSSCDPNCNKTFEHYNNLAKTHINFGIYNEAPHNIMCKFLKYKQQPSLKVIKTNPLCVTVENIYSAYLSNNINIFKIIDRESSPLCILKVYIYYLVKPEYHLDVYSDIMALSGLDNMAIKRPEV